MKTRGRKQNTRQTRRRYRSRILKNLKGGAAVENEKTGTVAVCGEDENACWFVVPHKFANSVGLDVNTQLVWNAFTNFFREGGISAEDLSQTIHSTCNTEASIAQSQEQVPASAPEPAPASAPEPELNLASSSSTNSTTNTYEGEEIPTTIYKPLISESESIPPSLASETGLEELVPSGTIPPQGDNLLGGRYRK
jgi:hypothetical protein